MFLGGPLFVDRRDAGRRLGAQLRAGPACARPCVYGLARGGVEVAVEVAAALQAPLDALAVRKVRHPLQPEYAIGAVAPDGVSYVRGSEDHVPREIERALNEAVAEAAELDARLHADRAHVDPAGGCAVLVDDGAATGATLVAACRWAHAAGAAQVVAAVPAVARQTVPVLHDEADRVVALAELDPFIAVSVWYAEFDPLEDSDVLRLLDEARALA